MFHSIVPGGNVDPSRGNVPVREGTSFNTPKKPLLCPEPQSIGALPFKFLWTLLQSIHPLPSLEFFNAQLLLFVQIVLSSPGWHRVSCLHLFLVLSFCIRMKGASSPYVSFAPSSPFHVLLLILYKNFFPSLPFCTLLPPCCFSVRSLLPFLFSDFSSPSRRHRLQLTSKVTFVKMAPLVTLSRDNTFYPRRSVFFFQNPRCICRPSS